MHNDIPLGKLTKYKNQYDANLLFPISRAEKWSEYKVSADVLPFRGADIWNAFEVSWLNEIGVPQVRVAKFIIPVTTQNIIESKSFKLYLNSFNQTHFENEQDVLQTITDDLSNCAKGNIQVIFYPLSHTYEAIDYADWQCIDDSMITTPTYHYRPIAAPTHTTEQVTSQKLVSHLLKSNCPVTSQPDWASLFIEYSGQKIDEAALLTYIIGFREHNDFHEQCVERIFMDLSLAYSLQSLTVYARYTRRGGLDINPYRSTESIEYTYIPNWKLARQ